MGVLAVSVVGLSVLRTDYRIMAPHGVSCTLGLHSHGLNYLLFSALQLTMTVSGLEILEAAW